MVLAGASDGHAPRRVIWFNADQGVDNFGYDRCRAGDRSCPVHATTRWRSRSPSALMIIAAIVAAVALAKRASGRSQTSASSRATPRRWRLPSLAPHDADVSSSCVLLSSVLESSSAAYGCRSRLSATSIMSVLMFAIGAVMLLVRRNSLALVMPVARMLNAGMGHVRSPSATRAQRRSCCSTWQIFGGLEAAAVEVVVDPR